MTGAISSTQGSSAAYQANFAATQQHWIQQLFQAAGGTNGGTISETQFENFYNQFMNGRSAQNGTTISTQTKAAADELYQQFDSSGNGLTQTEFAAALKQMMAQKAQGHRHHHHHDSATGAASGSQNAPQNAASSGTNSSVANSSAADSSTTNGSTDVLAILLVAVSESGASQSVQLQDSVSIEFTA
jgi:hypothetical protein